MRYPYLIDIHRDALCRTAPTHQLVRAIVTDDGPDAAQHYAEEARNREFPADEHGARCYVSKTGRRLYVGAVSLIRTPISQR